MKEVDLRELGRRIQIRRRQLGYTQEKLAEMMDVSIQMVSNLERGNKAIRIDNLVNLSRVLDVSSDYILTGKTTANDCTRLTEKLEKLRDTDRRMIEMIIV